MSKTFIIAEAGVNHNGNFQQAIKLVDMAYECGADAVKFQTFKAHESTGVYAEKASYQKENMPIEESQYDMLKKLELPFEFFASIKEYCEKKGIMFLSTPDGSDSLNFLINIGVDSIKIGSSEVTNFKFLKEIARANKHLILSTGMSTLGEVEAALNAIYAEGNTDVELMHCTTSYPTNIEDVNIKAMITMREAFKIPVGFSDHTLGFEAAISAVSLGAATIEKHITLNRDMEGPDHRASMPPDEFAKYVEYIRNTEKLLGNGVKKPVDKEIDIMKQVRRSIVAARYIDANEIIKEDMLAYKRPGIGLKPELSSLLIGKKIKRNLKKDELFLIDYI